jgi:hypothetical protein
MADQPLQDSAAVLQQPTSSLDVRHRPEDFGPFLTTRDLLQYLPCPSMAAARNWVFRHGIKRRNNGSFARVEVDRELKRPSRRGAHFRDGNRRPVVR